MTRLLGAIHEFDAPVVVLLAHPDDEALLCGGTIAALSDQGADVRVVCFSDGAQGRDRTFHNVCGMLGAKGDLLDLPSSSIRLDERLVAITDDLIRSLNPGCVITHTASGIQNQDHVALNAAVKLSIGRWPMPALALAVEPPISSGEFYPSVFVDITEHWNTKCEAVLAYREVLDRDCMSDHYLKTRARWWGQVAGTSGRLVEAYEMLRWRA